MSIVLGLSHFIGLTACDSLMKNDIKEIKKISGTSFKMLMNLIENVISSDPEFYSTLHMSLPEVEKIENNFKKSVEEWLHIVKSNDRNAFKKKMKELKKKYDSS